MKKNVQDYQMLSRGGQPCPGTCCNILRYGALTSAIFQKYGGHLCAPTELPKGLSDYAKKSKMTFQQVINEAVDGMQVEDLDASKQFNIAVIGRTGRP